MALLLSGAILFLVPSVFNFCNNLVKCQWAISIMIHCGILFNKVSSID